MGTIKSNLHLEVVSVAYRLFAVHSKVNDFIIYLLLCPGEAGKIFVLTALTCYDIVVQTD